MSETHPALFIELFEALPRQGPGSFASTRRALELCAPLPAHPRILDLGCGSGAQTIHLAQLTAGHIVAMDIEHALLARLRRTLTEAHDPPLRATIEVRRGDMRNPQLAASSFDLVWSEGALYNLGLERGMATCADVLCPGGALAFTDAVWRTSTPSSVVREAFADYETMGDVPNILDRIEAMDGWHLEGHFPLPPEAWWDEFYEPMQQRIDRLRELHAADEHALALLRELAAEPEMYRQHGSEYGYEFFVVRRS